MTMFEKYPALDTAWQFVISQDDKTLIVAGSFIFVLIVPLVFGRRKPVSGYEVDNPLLKANNIFLKIYPLLVFACWTGMLAGLILVGVGAAAHLGYIDIGTGFGPPLSLALYACAIPFGSAMGLWNFSDKKKVAIARIAAHQAAVKEAGPIRLY